jgi:hypothetical protein
MALCLPLRQPGMISHSSRWAQVSSRQAIEGGTTVSGNGIGLSTCGLPPLGFEFGSQVWRGVKRKQT